MRIPARRNKQNNTPVTFDGQKFASKREAARYRELLLLLKAGQISQLRTQVKFQLLPAQYRDGKCVERALNYIADFVYEENGEIVVEDVKGQRDPSSAVYAKFVIKRKLMLWFHGIRVREV